ncbi:GntR family transcriptional regulator [Mesosutterella sp. OilRF-GAM-744-9]|uniref:GntR family transcriptional regulator n=1 Tax=Mesosutterella porci TaxID=2915351 RepID=A0ABS9MPR5_9BURK|nr:GntR family transcriptional regulator [Mesosutterella sp. oilRF-744-WT-GAM-9]MCG5030591.1 GntR family transcriptional regulator [Mesosutterella sp. oilRF-744-WT-GAM-9]
MLPSSLDFLSLRSLPKRETLFEQTSRAIAECIRQGRWKPGEMLPNEVELAAALGVSQGTMRRALNMLVESGVLIRHQGRGTFVAEFSAHEDRVYQRYISLEPDDATLSEPSPTSSELVSFERAVAPIDISSALQVDATLPLVHAVRVLKTSTGLVTYDELWCHPEDFARLTAENLAHHEERMLYAFYQRVCGVTIVRSQETAKAVLMPQAICERYGLKSPLPVIEIRRISCTYGDRPVEFRRQLSVTEHYHYKL